jgi:DNA-binding transcriptional regulator WhiA
MEDMLLFLIPHYIEEGKNQLVISIGCTEVSTVPLPWINELGERLSRTDYAITLEHRDIERIRSLLEVHMSFSSDVKEEISLQFSSARHCRLAELSAILSYEGHIIRSGAKKYLKLQTENLVVARKYFTLIRKTFNINNDVSIKTGIGQNKNSIYTMIIKDMDVVENILQATKLSPMDGAEPSSRLGLPDHLVVQNACCKRAFIRGAFLSSGSMSDPQKAYHLEIVLSDLLKAEQ